MWVPNFSLSLPISLLGLAAQVPFQPSPSSQSLNAMVVNNTQDFAFKEGSSIFSPKDLIELARPGTGVANSAGDLLLISSSKYSLKNKKNNKSIYIASIESTVQPLEIPLANGGEAFWLDSRTIAHAVAEGEGKDKVIALYAVSVKYETESITPDSPVFIGKFPTDSASNFIFNGKSDYLVFSDNVHSDGDLKAVKKHDEEWENRGDTAYVYEETFDRQWDAWVGPKKSSLFTVALNQGPGGKWVLGTEFVNLLHGTKHHTPILPFGGTDDFDVSANHVVYTAKDPELPPAWHTKQNIYITDLEGSSKPKELTSGKQGATHAPVLSQQGDKVAWVELAEDGYETDRGKVIIYDLKKDVRYTLTEKWDRTSSELAFSPDGHVLYVVAAEHARSKVFAIPLPETPSSSNTEPTLSDFHHKPHVLTHTGSASAIQALSDGRLLFTSSSLTGPNDVYIIRGLSEKDVAASVKIEQLTKFTADALEGKDLQTAGDFWFDGVDQKIHGFIQKPPGFKVGDKKKWPLLFFIHGGPQGMWADQWSTRWNPNVFAHQGYVVVAINPTGSTSFGQALTDAIQKEWGGKPFDDLVKGHKYIIDNYPEIDPERAVAAGGSWGGYAINWIQGHPEYGFGFKALFCHDGVFDVRYMGYATDELFFSNHEWAGRPWEPEAKEIMEKYNPTNFVQNWSTPMLIVHGSKDFRVVETEGIGAFHALQERGVPSRLVIFPDENHWTLSHGNSLKWHWEVLRWFDKYVGEH
ncbi:Alpha/Beta hydrolase protein [Cytidiella melzeri]|nr:Alpha/Beta hydrolase protein [Cytidiella melzeri]